MYSDELLFCNIISYMVTEKFEIWKRWIQRDDVARPWSQFAWRYVSTWPK